MLVPGAVVTAPAGTVSRLLPIVAVPVAVMPLAGITVATVSVVAVSMADVSVTLVAIAVTVVMIAMTVLPESAQCKCGHHRHDNVGAVPGAGRDRRQRQC